MPGSKLGFQIQNIETALEYEIVNLKPPNHKIFPRKYSK